MINISEINKQRIREFLGAHEQHEINIKVHTRHDELRIGIHLSFHNGHNWQGYGRTCYPKHVNRQLRQLFRTAKEYRPDLFRGLLR